MPASPSLPVHRNSRDVELDTYMRDVARHPVMSAADERSRATRIVELRVAYWRALLGYPPHVAAIAALVRSELGDAVPALEPALQAAEQAATDVRGRRVKRFIEAYEAATIQLATELSAADPEGHVADRLSADLVEIGAGSLRGVGLEVPVPRQGSRPFAEHVHHVQAAAAALAVERNHFARANLRLVVRMAHQYRRSGLPLSDLVQEGNLGLLKAVDRFDVSKGFRFSTYASWWIRHHIRRAVVNRARTIRLPQHVHTLASRLQGAKVELRRELGREPTDKEIAAAARVSPDKVDATREALATRSISLDAPVSETDARAVAETLAAEPGSSPADQLDLESISRRLRGAMLHLEPMEQDILRQRFGLDGATEKTLAEIGQQYSLSRERIRQLQVTALARMRDRLGDAGLPSLDA